jgi:hypothetical protein
VTASASGSSFKKSGITLGTLGDMAKKDGWRGSAVTRRTVSTGSSSGGDADAPPPIITKPEKLETAELSGIPTQQMR